MRGQRCGDAILRRIRPGNSHQETANSGLEIPRALAYRPPIVDQWPPVVPRRHAGVVELVDALDSKSSSERSVGSIPTARTIIEYLGFNNQPTDLRRDAEGSNRADRGLHDIGAMLVSAIGLSGDISPAIRRTMWRRNIPANGLAFILCNWSRNLCAWHFAALQYSWSWRGC